MATNCTFINITPDVDSSVLPDTPITFRCTGIPGCYPQEDSLNFVLTGPDETEHTVINNGVFIGSWGGTIVADGDDWVVTVTSKPWTYLEIGQWSAFIEIGCDCG